MRGLIKEGGGEIDPSHWMLGCELMRQDPSLSARDLQTRMNLPSYAMARQIWYAVRRFLRANPVPAAGAARRTASNPHRSLIDKRIRPAPVPPISEWYAPHRE